MAEETNPFLKVLGNFLLGATDRTTISEAQAMGRPEATGLTRDQLRQFLQEPERQREAELFPLKKESISQDIAGGKTLQELRQTKIRAQKQLSDVKRDPLFSIANSNIQKRIGNDPTIFFQLKSDPELEYQMIQDELEGLRRAKAGKVGEGKGKSAAKAGASGKIRVRRKADGVAGTINESDFDAARYEKVQ